MGQGLSLPPFLEQHRAEIEPRLTPLPDTRAWRPAPAPRRELTMNAATELGLRARLCPAPTHRQRLDPAAAARHGRRRARPRRARPPAGPVGGAAVAAGQGAGGRDAAVLPPPGHRAARHPRPARAHRRAGGVRDARPRRRTGATRARSPRWASPTGPTSRSACCCAIPRCSERPPCCARCCPTSPRARSTSTGPACSSPPARATHTRRLRRRSVWPRCWTPRAPRCPCTSSPGRSRPRDAATCAPWRVGRRGLGVAGDGAGVGGPR